MKHTFLLICLVSSFSFGSIRAAIGLVGMRPKVEGPNCWNYALFSFGLSNSIRNVDQNEFASIINSPLCQKLGPYETDFSSTIGAIREIDERTRQITDIHAFVYLNNNLVISKNGAGSRSAYVQDTFERLMAIGLYTVNSSCQFNVASRTVLNSSLCKKFLERYRCTSIPNFIKKSRLETASVILRLVKSLTEFEKTLQQESLFLKRLDNESTAFHISNIKRDIIDISAQKTFSSHELTILKILAAQLHGVSGQLYYEHASPLMDYFESFGVSVDRVVQKFEQRLTSGLSAGSLVDE